MRVLGGHNPARECLPIDPPENDLMQLRAAIQLVKKKFLEEQ